MPKNSVPIRLYLRGLWEPPQNFKYGACHMGEIKIVHLLLATIPPTILWVSPRSSNLVPLYITLPNQHHLHVRRVQSCATEKIQKTFKYVAHKEYIKFFRGPLKFYRQNVDFKPKRTAAASHGFLATARFTCV